MISTEQVAEFWAGVENAERFFMNDAPVNHALRKLVAILDREGIPYAIVGAMALNMYGYRRVTTDVDVLLTADGLAQLKANHLGRNYVEKFAGSRGLRDPENNVGIAVLVAGDYPGSGKPQPVRFPDPAAVARKTEFGAFIELSKLVELKLASGAEVYRMKDLTDVFELIRAIDLPRDLGNQLDPTVRAKYDELWQAAQIPDPQHER